MSKKNVTSSQPAQKSPSKSTPKFLIQVRGQSGVTPQMSVNDFIEGSKEHFERIADVVQVAGETLIERIKKLAQTPSECEVEFGINAEGEVGVPFVTKGTLGANFTVTIKWITK